MKAKIVTGEPPKPPKFRRSKFKALVDLAREEAAKSRAKNKPWVVYPSEPLEPKVSHQSYYNLVARYGVGSDWAKETGESFEFQLHEKDYDDSKVEGILWIRQITPAKKEKSK